MDTAKGIGILLVLYGHSISQSTRIGGIIYAFHMPLFFILSGLMLRGTISLDFAGVKRKLIYKPAVIYAVFLLLGVAASLSWLDFASGNARAQLIRYASVLTGHPIFNGPLWFLVALSGGRLLLWLINGCVELDRRRIIRVVICAFLLLAALMIDRMPYAVKNASPLMMLEWPLVSFFLLAGYMLKDAYKALCNCRIASVLLLGTTSAIMEIYCAAKIKCFGMSNHLIGSCWFLPAAFFGSLAVTAVSVIISRNRVCARILERIGVLSLYFFALDFVVRPILMMLLHSFNRVFLLFPERTSDYSVALTVTFAQLGVIALIVPLAKRFTERLLNKFNLS